MKHIDCNPISPEFRNYKPKLNSKHQLISNLSFEKLKSNLTTNVEPDKNLKLKKLFNYKCRTRFKFKIEKII